MSKLSNNDVKLIETKEFFLPEEIQNREDNNKLYSLEKEFAKAKKNRSWRYIVIFTLFFALLGAATVLITKSKEKKLNKFTFKITETESLELQQLVSSVNKDNRFIQKLHNDVREIQKKKVVVTANKKLSAKEKKIKIDSFDEIIAQKLSQIKSLTLERQKRQLELSNKMQHVKEMVNNSQALQDLRLRKQQREYDQKIIKLILKYNPIYKGKKIKSIINKRVKLSQYKKQEIKFKSIYRSASLYSKVGIDVLNQEIQEIDFLIKKLKATPYVNHVPKLLRHLEAKKTDIIAELHKIINRATSKLSYRTNLLNSYRYALNALAREKSEGGFIIDARNKNHLILFINPAISLKGKTEALVFRKDDEFIARIEITKISGAFIGYLKDLQPNKEVKPFDKILIKSN